MLINAHSGVVFFAILQYVQLSISDRTLSDDECQAQGFNRKSLQCSSCNELAQFHLDLLVADCNSCCTKDVVNDQSKKFASAVIQYCECNLMRFPQIQAFVKSDLAYKWGKRVKLQEVRGTLPTIVLKDAFGEVQDSMNIAKWDTDDITEFLNSGLEQ
ncbi:hypothetical protein AB6A40_001008 [Gnathostoma spinigerum]|uniref:Selenoprotein F n=1 Tax=Gnathostoma spinigerum TaxID=75299 RepID=A0ABD6EAB7_9BILA